MHKSIQLLMVSSLMLSGCVAPSYQRDHHPYTSAVNKEQIITTVENVVQLLDDNYKLSPTAIGKVETLFSVNLSDANARHIKDHRLWQTMTPDGLYFVAVNFSDDPNGSKLVDAEWKKQFSEDYLTALKNHTTPITDHCATPADIAPFMESRGWKLVPSKMQLPIYSRDGTYKSTHIIFGGSEYGSSGFGPCLAQVAIIQAPDQTTNKQ